MIVGAGTVLVARKPFAVTTWLNRGHYRTGETIEAGVRAQTLDHKPVAGKGTLKLLSISYDALGKPVETPVESWELVLNGDGQATQTLKAAARGNTASRLSSMTARGTRSREVTCFRSWARNSTAPRSATTISRSSPTARSISRARRSGS